jgi:lipopolysaccharide export system permease protein
LRLHLYILRELLVGFGFALGGMLVLALPAIAVAAVSKLAGVDTLAMLCFVPLLMAGLVPYILPLSYLLAVVVTYGRLASDNEWTAAVMSGRNPLAMLLPAFLLALVLTGFMLWLVAEELPEIRERQSEYEVRALRSTVTSLGRGRTERHLGKFYISAGWRDGDDFLDALIYIPRRGSQGANTILAERVHIEVSEKEMIVRFRNMRVVRGEMDVRSGDPVVRLDLDELQREGAKTFVGMRYRKASDLARDLASGAFDGDPERAQSVRFEIHERLAVSSTCLLFLLLGAPTGLLLRRGTQLSALATAVGYALLYYLLSMRLSKQLALGHVLSPETGAWAIDAVGVVFGLVLLRKAMMR